MTDKLSAYLHDLYSAEQAANAYEKLNNLMAAAKQRITAKDKPERYSNKDVILITYGDSVQQAGEAPLKTLYKFAIEARLPEVFSTIHLLPFHPYSSDDGFSVMDYYKVNPALGTWEDIEKLRGEFSLMFDGVFNHMSAKSKWFQKFLADDPAYAGMFLTESPNTDLSSVSRPRALPLLTPFNKKIGETVHIWTTFSEDQVDFDVRNPETLLRLLEVLLFYVEKGASLIRLDAIAYLWKEVGTNCIHLPQTHLIVQLMRAVLDEVAPQVILITETNVPHSENISYFGDGYNEAQMVYNFTLPPLLMYTILHGTTTKFREWMNSLKTPSQQTTFFNFTASHDGIGVRPVEGILTPDEVQSLIRKVYSTGGRVNFKQNPDGSQSPYELNASYVDALTDPRMPQAVQARQVLLSQGIQLALAGVPAVYIHSLVGSRNALVLMEKTGDNRAINRAKLDFAELEITLHDSKHFRYQVFQEYWKMLLFRRHSKFFHPHSPQTVLDLGNDSVLAIQRGWEGDEQMLTLFNVTRQDQTFRVPKKFAKGADWLNGDDRGRVITLRPYEQAWIST